VSLGDSHANFHLVEKVMPTCLKQYRQRHVCRAQKRKIAEPLYVVHHGLSSFLNRGEEFVHCHFGVILIESGEESSFHVNLIIDETVRKAPESVKSYHLGGANE